MNMIKQFLGLFILSLCLIQSSIAMDESAEVDGWGSESSLGAHNRKVLHGLNGSEISSDNILNENNSNEEADEADYEADDEENASGSENGDAARRARAKLGKTFSGEVQNENNDEDDDKMMCSMPVGLGFGTDNKVTVRRTARRRKDEIQEMNLTGSSYSSTGDTIVMRLVTGATLTGLLAKSKGIINTIQGSVANRVKDLKSSVEQSIANKTASTRASLKKNKTTIIAGAAVGAVAMVSSMLYLKKRKQKAEQVAKITQDSKALLFTMMNNLTDFQKSIEGLNHFLIKCWNNPTLFLQCYNEALNADSKNKYNEEMNNNIKIMCNFIESLGRSDSTITAEEVTTIIKLLQTI